MGPTTRLWLARVLIGLVTAWNLQAAFVFMASPQIYVPGFMLAGVPGQAAVRGVGVLFVMWNIPYLVALWQPVRYRLALQLSLAMQITGVVGETLIYLTLPGGYPVLSGSLQRFMAFDVAGFLLLGGAFLLTQRESSR